MTVCYHIQTHKDPDQIVRLVRFLTDGSPGCLVHVNHDRRGVPLDEAALKSLGRVWVDYTDGGYGDFSHVDRHLHVIRRLVDSGTKVDWLVNITGQDYPLMPMSRIEQELTDCPGDGYLEYFRALGGDSTWPHRRSRSRYYFQHRRLRPLTPTARRRLHRLQVVNYLQPLVRVHVSYGLTVGRRARVPFGPGFEVYGGSAFMSLNWDVVTYLDWYARTHPEILEYFRRTLSPVEATFHTILLNSGKFTFVNDCKRYFDFSRSQYNHPKNLDFADLPAAFASGAHFGRKFDAHHPAGILDAVEEHIASGGGRTHHDG